MSNVIRVIGVGVFRDLSEDQLIARLGECIAEASGFRNNGRLVALDLNGTLYVEDFATFAALLIELAGRPDASGSQR